MLSTSDRSTRTFDEFICIVSCDALYRTDFTIVEHDSEESVCAR